MMILGKIKENIFDAFFAMLIFSIPFSLKIPNALLIALTAFLLFDYKGYSKVAFFALKKTPFYVLFALIFYWFLKAAITNSISDTNYSLLLPVIILPVLFLKVKNKDLFLWTILVLSFLLSFIGIYGLLNFYHQHHQFLPFEGEVINDVLGMERPYLGFIAVLGFISSLQLAMKYSKFKNWLFCYSLYIGGFIFLISARISALTVLFLIFIYLLFYLKLSNKKKLIFTLLSITTLICSLLLNKNLRERFFITSNIEKSMAKLNRHEPRMVIWACAYDIATDPGFNKFFGLNSEKELEGKYLDCYNEKMTNRNRAAYFITTKKNSHNQFLDIYLVSGIIGLSLFIYFFLAQFFLYRNEYFKIAMIISLVLFLVVENVLRRQMGVYIFILVISYINLGDLNFKQKKDINYRF